MPANSKITKPSELNGKTLGGTKAAYLFRWLDGFCKLPFEAAVLFRRLLVLLGQFLKFGNGVPSAFQPLLRFGA